MFTLTEIVTKAEKNGLELIPYGLDGISLIDQSEQYIDDGIMLTIVPADEKYMYSENLKGLYNGIQTFENIFKGAFPKLVYDQVSTLLFTIDNLQTEPNQYYLFFNSN